MNHTSARTLLELLLELGRHELDDRTLATAEPRVRAAIGALDGPELAERFDYDCYEVDWFGLGPKQIQGLALAESSLLMSEIIDQLAALDDRQLEPLFATIGLSTTKGRSVLHAVYWILNSLEWESRDRTVDDVYTDGKRESMLAASLRRLQNYREHGEP